MAMRTCRADLEGSLEMAGEGGHGRDVQGETCGRGCDREEEWWKHTAAGTAAVAAVLAAVLAAAAAATRPSSGSTTSMPAASSEGSLSDRGSRVMRTMPSRVCDSRDDDPPTRA